MNYPFNVRVYGLLLDDAGRILISDEEEYGLRFSKFPGGGLEFGEGLIQGLIREFREECVVEIDVLEHFYTTDFFTQSVFNKSQVISVYYFVKPKSDLELNFKTEQFDFDTEDDIKQAFRWVEVEAMQVQDLTFDTDQRVLELLKKRC